MKLFIALLVAAACSAPATSTTTMTVTHAPVGPAGAAPTAFSVKVSGAGRPVIFIPGLASPGSVWDGTIAHLGGKVQAHVLTLAGFAGQPPIAPPFMQQVHDQIIDYIKSNHLDHPVIVGHSLGGVMSLWLAETDPDIGVVIDVDGMPFLAGVMDPSMTSAKAAAQGKEIRAQMVKMTADQFTEQMKQSMAGMITKADDVSRMLTESMKSDHGTMATAVAELIAIDLRPDLGKITVPVVIIASSVREDANPDQIAAAWHSQIDAIPHVDFQTVAQAKHFVMIDQPEAFYARVDKALAR
jgi:pimeloyl-ACP methyl ester carboxylesterase